VLSAGVNVTLFGALEDHRDFYRDAEGRIKKGVVLKVSDFRSAMVQGRLLAKKGIEVREYRIESGLNCGGHAFATEGVLLGPILEQFREARAELAGFGKAVATYYEKRGWAFAGGPLPPRITVQGGIGTFGENRRLLEHYGVDGVGWATPFLLVPEATAVDDDTRARLAAATSADLYLSQASPFGLPLNNLRTSSSAAQVRTRIDAGKPGAPCPHGYLASNTEFSELPLCVASAEYQKIKLAALGFDAPPPADSPDPRVQALYRKECLCQDLGNGALIEMGLLRAGAPVSICPGPNLAYFDRTYSLREMVDHIYGRGPSLTPAWRPHMFAGELGLYLDEYDKLVAAALCDPAAAERVAVFRANLEDGLAHYRGLAREPAYPGENLASLTEAIARAERRLRGIPRTAAAEAQPAAPL